MSKGKLFAITLKDSSLVLTRLVEATKIEDELDKLSFKDDIVDVTEIKDEDIQCESKIFRNSWKLKNGKVVEDLAKAKEIHMERIRHKRNKKLEGLDLDFMLALEAGNGPKLDSLREEKQKLRDLPQKFKLTKAKCCKTLCDTWPEDLEKHEDYEYYKNHPLKV